MGYPFKKMVVRDGGANIIKEEERERKVKGLEMQMRLAYQGIKGKSE